MVGGTWTTPSRPIPAGASDWLSNKQWCTLLEMVDMFEIMKGFDVDFEKDI